MTVSVTLTGTDFTDGMTIAATGIAASNIQLVDSKTATADFAVATTASVGLHTILLTAAGGSTTAALFTVVPAVPSLTAINPSFSAIGSDINVILTGSNFVVGMTINAGSDITSRNVSVRDSTTATATLSIAVGAALGEHDVIVTTGGGTSAAAPFSVVSRAPPTLVKISPEGSVQDSTLTVSLIGTNFVPGLTINAPPGVTVSSINVTNTTAATATFQIAPDAEFGAHGVTVTTVGGTSESAPFTTFPVFAVPPTLTQMSPASGSQGTAVDVTLTGNYFSSGLSVLTDGAITVSNVAVTNSSTARATLSIDAAAGLGPHSVSVVTPGGTSSPLSFTVLLPPPTIASLSPTSGLVGTSVDLTITGTNFVPGLGVEAGGNIAVSNVTVIDSTTATARLTLDPVATPGDRVFAVRSSVGAAISTFTVVPLPPVLTTIDPASAIQSSLGRTYTVAMTGTNLFAPSIAIDGTGVTVSAFKATSTTTATAIFAVAANANLGPRNVTVTTLGGTSPPVTFNVLTPVPVITSIDPAILVRGTSARITVTGLNFVADATTVESIPGITVSDIGIANPTSMAATFVISASAALGARNLQLTTPLGTSAPANLTVADPFPDLSIAGSHSADFGVGFHESYTVTVANRGTSPSTGPMTVVDVLPAGLTFVSGTGTGWTCSAAGQTVTCASGTLLDVNASSSYTLTVAVSNSAAAVVNHTVSVSSAGDLNAANNSATDATKVAPTPSPMLTLTPKPLVAGQQASAAVNLATSFPHDVTGTLTMTFKSSALIPIDDPAIQFATGGRSVTFTIPANSTQALFGDDLQSGPLAFQPGTVAGSLTMSGTFAAGAVQETFAPPASIAAGLGIPLQAPVIQTIQTNHQSGLVASITLFSTPREVTQLTLTFNTQSKLSLSCAATSGCSASGNTLVLDVQSFFSDWFAADTQFGSLNILRLPLSISGTLRGTVDVTLSNRFGASQKQSFNLP